MNNKSTSKLLLFIIASLLLGSNTYAAYFPLTLTGFNADVVADVAGNANGSTSADVDGVNYVFMSQSYNTSGTSYMPNGGIVNSVVASTPSLTYQLQPYTANNSLRLTSGSTGILTLTTPVSLEHLYVLATTGSGSSTVTMTVTFTDLTTQVFTGQSVPDWFGGANFAIQGLGRTLRTTNVITNSTVDPRLYQIDLALLASNYVKLVQSVTFNGTGGVLNVMAISGFNNIPCTGTPTAGTAVANPNNPCPGATVNLNLSGLSAFGGLGFQWFRSTTPTGPWIPLPGGNNAVYSFTASVPYYYRCIVTCLNSGQYDSSTSVYVQVQPWSPTSPCYCTSNATSTADEEITNVTIGVLNNSTTCATPFAGSQGTGIGLANQFADFTTSTVPVPLLYQGLAQPFTLTVGSCGTFNYSNAFKVYIDYNHNASFTDPGEEVYFSGTTALTCVPPTTVNASINVPISALTGITRMRVINREGGQATATTIVPCGTYGYGETEDYLVNIIAPTPQDPAVSAITGPSGNCFTANETINVTVKNYGSQNINCFNNPVKVYLYDNNVLVDSVLLNTIGSTLSAYGNNSLTATFNNVNLYAGGSHCLNTSLTIGSAGGVVNGNLWNDSLANAVCFVNYRPTAGPDYELCQFDFIPFGQGLTVSGCATPIYDSITLNFTITGPCTDNTGATTTGTSTGPNNANCGDIYACAFANAVLPVLPAGASFTSPGILKVTNLATVGASYQSEVRMNLYGANLNPTNIYSPGQIGATGTGSTGFNYQRNISINQISNMYSGVGGGGTVNMGYWESYNDVVAGSDVTINAGGTTVATLKFYYQYVPASFEWYNVPINGTNLYSFSPFNPLTTAGSGITNSNITGTTTFYAACAGSSNCRIPVNLIIKPTPLVFQDTLSACETPAGSNGAVFDLTTMDGFVSGFQIVDSVRYYNDIGTFIDVPYPTMDTSSTNFVYAKVFNGGCSSVDSLLLQVNMTPDFATNYLTGFACVPACVDVASLINPFATIPVGTDTLYYDDDTYTSFHPNPHCINSIDTVYMVFQTNSTPSCNDTAIAIVNVQGGNNEIANQMVPGNYSDCSVVGTNIFSLTDGNSDTVRTSTDCKKVAAVYDIPNSIDLGAISVFEDIICPTPIHNGQPYVNRYYQITPTTNDTAMVCLFYLDDDFASYNYTAVTGSPTWPLLPTSLNLQDSTHICITKVDGGDLNTPGHTAIAIPNSQITSSFDPIATVWTVCFPVSSFSYFYCHACNPSNTPLPVILTDFKGRRVNETSVLTWTTKTEINNSHFIVERSRDAKMFTSISTSIPTKAPNGTSSSELKYAYKDNTPMQGHNYYRLAQYDIDGKQSLSDVVDVYFGDETMVTMYPNPVNTELSIDINTPKATNASVKILDATGRVVRSLELQLSIGMNHSQVDLNGLADGIYMVKVSNGKGLNYSQTVRKN